LGCKNLSADPQKPVVSSSFSDVFVLDLDLKAQIVKTLREYIPDICKCINQSHFEYGVNATKVMMLSSGLVRTLGDMRLINAEVLFEIAKLDLHSPQSLTFDTVHDSTFHILLIWAIQKFHNNIYLVKFTEFFVQFCKRASNLSLVNAIIKTNLIADLASFFMESIYSGSTASRNKAMFICFFTDIVKALKEAKDTVKLSLKLEKELSRILERVGQEHELEIPRGNFEVC
jgi:hypothetical protein